MRLSLATHRRVRATGGFPDRANQEVPQRRAARVLAQLAAKERQRPVPRLLRPDRVVLSLGNPSRPDGGVVGEGMMSQVAVKIKRHSRLTQFLLQLYDSADREKLVLRGPMRL